MAASSRHVPTPSRRFGTLAWAGLVTAITGPLLLSACEDALGPDDFRLSFSTAALDLGSTRASMVSLTNSGGGALGPVQISAGPVSDNGGGTVPGVTVDVNPAFISTIHPGAAFDLSVAVALNAALPAGQYETTIRAEAGADASAAMTLRFEVGSTLGVELKTLAIVAGPGTVRQGDVVQFAAQGTGPDGATVDVLDAQWSVNPPENGMFTATGQLVAYEPGPLTVLVSAGSLTQTKSVEVTARGLAGSATVVGLGAVSNRFTSDLWLYGNHGYTGTWNRRTVGGTGYDGNVLHTWDVSSPGQPRRTATLEVDARTVNDVKVRGDGTLGIITHEGSNDGLNGVTLLNLSTPSRPTSYGRFTAGLESGVHNVWIEGNYAYLVVDGTAGGLRVLDVSNPTNPSIVASYYEGSSILHDVYVRDGLAFLSHWDAGLVILDVGNGIAGGSPTSPERVGGVRLGGQTHNAWYWPDAGYVFVGEEDFGSPGITHIVDVRDLRRPVEVATFAVPGTTPHNFWLDESRGVLYLAWYDNGLRALDVTGTLLGDLGRQGREYFGAVYNGGSCGDVDTGTCTWAPQLHNGLVWVSDMNSGLIALDVNLP